MISREGTFGTFEAVCLTVIVMMTKIFYTSISLTIKSEGTSGWYGTIISCLLSLVFFSLIYLLMKRFPGMDITQIFETVLGKVFGKILTLCFAAYGLFSASANLREFIEMIKIYNLPYTPPSILIFGFIAVCAIVAYTGLECLARMASIFLVPVLIGILLILVLASPYYNIDYLKPYLGYGFMQTLKTGVLRSSAYDEVFILTIIITSLHNLKSFKKAGYFSILISGAIFSVTIVCNIMAFMYNAGSENISGLFELSRAIYFNRFVQRLESVFLFTWVISSLLAVSLIFYISMNLYSKAFNIPNHRPMIYPFCFLLFMVALIPKNISEVILSEIHFIRQYSLFFVYLVPIIVLLIAVILRKRGGADVKGG